MKKPILLLYIMMFAFSSCQKKGQFTQKQNQTPISPQLKIDTASVENKPILQKKDTAYLSKFLSTDNFLVNGHKMLMTKREFKANIKTTDSTSTDLWECGNPFEWLDKEWMIKTYGPEDEYAGTFQNFDSKITSIYANGVEYNTNNHLYLFGQGRAKKNTFTVISHEIRLDQNTTSARFQKLFPNAEPEVFDKSNNVRFRFYLSDRSEDAFLFYFKNGRLDYVILWWLLC